MSEVNSELLKPIPQELPDVSGWKEVPIQENGEPLVPLGPFSNHDSIFTSSVYAGEKSDSPYFKNPLKGCLITVFARESVADQLFFAQTLLPSRLHLIALDVYRPLEVQQAAYDFYLGKLREKNLALSDEELAAETQKYVSLPSTDPSRPSPHNTGCAVDVVIVEYPDYIQGQLGEIDQRISTSEDWEEIYRLEMRRIALMGEHGSQLNLGTPFDWGEKEASLNYYEVLEQQRALNHEEQQAQLNRRLLYNVMTQADFEPYLYEWWHFNSKKSQMGAITAGEAYAEYGAAVFSSENANHEEMRRNHRLGSIRIFGGTNAPIDQIRVVHPEIDVVRQSVDESGDIRHSTWQYSAIISP